MLKNHIYLWVLALPTAWTFHIVLSSSTSSKVFTAPVFPSPVPSSRPVYLHLPYTAYTICSFFQVWSCKDEDASDECPWQQQKQYGHVFPPLLFHQRHAHLVKLCFWIPHLKGKIKHNFCYWKCCEMQVHGKLCMKSQVLLVLVEMVI